MRLGTKLMDIGIFFFFFSSFFSPQIQQMNPSSLPSHVGDFGTPIGLVLGECFLSSTSPQEVNARDLSQLYVSAKQKAGENPEFYEFAKTICLHYQRLLLDEEVPSLEFEGRVWEGKVRK